MIATRSPSHHSPRRTPSPPLPAPCTPHYLPPVSLAHYAEKDKAWVRPALAAANGSLAASKRRLRQHLKSLPKDSPEALNILSFLRFGP